MQLFSLSAGGLGEAEALPEIDGTIEEHAWSPDGSRILVRTAGMHADSAGADGSGALESEGTCPSGYLRSTPGRTGRSGGASGWSTSLPARFGCCRGKD